MEGKEWDMDRDMDMGHGRNLTDRAVCSLYTNPRMSSRSTFPPSPVRWVSSPTTSHRSNN
jgi:hypothetical protein